MLTIITDAIVCLCHSVSVSVSVSVIAYVLLPLCPLLLWVYTSTPVCTCAGTTAGRVHHSCATQSPAAVSYVPAAAARRWCLRPHPRSLRACLQS